MPSGKIMIKDVIEKIEREKVVAIIRGVETENIVAVANALSLGGINLVEVTFNQKQPQTFEQTAKAISLIKENPAIYNNTGEPRGHSVK